MADFEDVIDAINKALDSADTSTANTSMRIPTALRDAAAMVVNELGAAPSTTALTSSAMRSAIEAIAMQAVLDNHYRKHPSTRPSLADLAIAAAELDGHPLAAHHDRIRSAALEIVERHPNADSDDVLLWAEARMLSAA
jgi:hypothetical protein